MSEHPAANDSGICPNCNSVTTKNFCAQCGQSNHLHKETFWGLIMHFVGHYFHYDSKFWQTLKTLWLKPGALTIAYWNKQRMRFIPPISLYIFISAVFFLIAFSIKDDGHTTKQNVHTLRQHLDSMDRENNALPGDNVTVDGLSFSAPEKNDSSKVQRYIQGKLDKLEKKHPNSNEYIQERYLHNLPKIFFFMIPVVAIFLKLLFLRRKTAYFVDHAIFSLHLHSFLFCLVLFSVINPFDKIQYWLTIISLIVYATYVTIAIRKAYKVGIFRSIISTAMMTFAYLFIFGLAIVFNLIFIILTV